MKGRRLGFVGLAALALMLVLGLGTVHRGTFSSLAPSAAVYAQAPSPGTPAASPSPVAPPETSPPAEPAPAAGPADTPAASPDPTLGTPTPAASPSPVETLPAPPEEASDTPTLPLVGNYDDPQQRFQIGILEGYKVSTVAGSPLFEAEDGSMAYTVVAVPPISATAAPALSDQGLLQVAQDVFRRGEGFQTTGFEPNPQGGITISWLGRLTIGGTPQPMQGTILARQSEGSAFLLLIAATETATENLPAATGTLSESFQL